MYRIARGAFRSAGDVTLILPNYAASGLGPLYSTSQLIFAGLVSLILYCSFVFIQTVRHRGYVLRPGP